MPWLIFLCFFLWVPGAHTQDIAPEPSSDFQEKQTVSGENHMVVTAHPLASQAAFDMLTQGGSAVDAAISAQIMLTLVEPQSSGIGGGGFLLYYDAKRDSLTSFDGRETAPAGAEPNMFLDKNAAPLPLIKAVRNGTAVGVPGLLATLKITHERYGKLPWETLFQPAIHTAREGFAVSERLRKNLTYSWSPSLSKPLRSLYPNQLKIGDVIDNPALAKTLEDIAQNGIDAFYQGARAQRMVEAVRKHGGALSLYDLEEYHPIERLPVCGDYRGYSVCSMGAPSAGGIGVLQTLKMLKDVSLNAPYESPEIHLILEAQKRAFADLNHYIGDPDFVQLPTSRLLNDVYLERRAQDITAQASGVATHGSFSQQRGRDASHDAPSTSHISIVDAQGNAVSLTSSVEHSFGSGILVDGFVLNNQLTDFSFLPERDGLPIANAVAPGKRPRSSMAPTIIFDASGKLRYVLGSPGGSSIIPYVTKSIIALIDWKLPLQEALDAPHFTHKNTHATVESGNAPLADALRALGHEVRIRDHSSGVHLIHIDESGTLHGAADSRRGGLAMGE